MDAIDVGELNPGIRMTVSWLRKLGFDTCDSGDGVTHEYECDRDYAYVVIRVGDPADLIRDTHLLAESLAQVGIKVGVEGMDPATGTGVFITGTYDPSNKLALIDLSGLDDAKLSAAMGRSS